MRTRKTIGHFVLVAATLCLLAPPHPISAVEPRFGRYGVLLDVPNTQDVPEGLWHIVEQLPERNYVAFTERNQFQPSPGVYLVTFAWNLSDTPSSGLVRRVLPKSFSFPPFEHYLGIGNHETISPDGHHTALLRQGKWQILSLPDMTLEVEFPISLMASTNSAAGFVSITWSDDSAYVAAGWSDDKISGYNDVKNQTGNWLLVYDIQKKKSLQQSIFPDLKRWAGQVVYAGNQWIITNDEKTGNIFTTCTTMLDICKTYTTALEVASLTVFPNKRAMLMETKQGDRGRQFWRWNRQLDDTYRIEASPLPLPTVPNFITLSPTGKYIALGRYLYDIDTGNMLQKMSDYETDSPLWLPSGDYFIMHHDFYVLGLYRVGQVDPIDTINVVDDILPNFTDRVRALDNLLPVGFSRDGQWMLMNLGNAGLLIPIVYQ